MSEGEQTPRLVLDTNCLIDLEEGRPDAIHVRALVDASRRKLVHLAVAAISASENQRNGRPVQNHADFEAKLARLDLGDVQQLLPLATWDVGFWDHMLWSSEELDAQAGRSGRLCFPTIHPRPIFRVRRRENGATGIATQCWPGAAFITAGVLSSRTIGTFTRGNRNLNDLDLALC